MIFKDKKHSRNKRVMRLVAAMMAVTLLVSLTGCTTFDNFRHTFIDKNSKQSDDTIYIGVYEPRSGDDSEEGAEEIKGIELANSMYHNVKGREVKLLTVDNQSSTMASKSAIEDLIDMEPLAIIGSAGEASSMVASPYIQKAGIPTITPSATNPMITENASYYFRATITGSQVGSGLAEYAGGASKTGKIGIISIDNDSSAAPAIDGFRDRLKDINDGSKEVAVQETISPDQKDFSKIIRKLKKENVDTVFLPVGYERADTFFRQIEKSGLTNITFLGQRDWSTSQFVKMMKKHSDIKVFFPSDNVTNASMTASENITPETQKFIIEYRNRYGSNNVPTDGAALGYDSYLLLVNAINTSPTLKRKDVRDALARTTNYRCATGVFTFDKQGNPERTVNISTIKNNRVVSAYVTSEKTQAQRIQKINKTNEN